MSPDERIANLEALLALARFEREFWRGRCLEITRRAFVATTGNEVKADYHVGVVEGVLAASLERKSRDAGLLK